MGNNAQSTICLGVEVNAEDIPWEPYDEDDWWRGETGYVRQGPELYTPDGNSYLAGVEPSDEESAAYFAEPGEWLAAHPLPVEVIKSGDADEPDLILAVPGTVKRTDWNGPIQFDPVEMVGKLHTDLELAAAYKRFRRFQAKYKIRGKPVWLLSSYWG